MVKPFRSTYWSREGGTGGVAGLTFCLLLTYSPILGLSEYKFKVVNICEMHWAGGLEAVMFDRFQRYEEIARKRDEKCHNSGNLMT